MTPDKLLLSRNLTLLIWKLGDRTIHHADRELKRMTTSVVWGQRRLKTNQEKAVTSIRLPHRAGTQQVRDGTGIPSHPHARAHARELMGTRASKPLERVRVKKTANICAGFAITHLFWNRGARCSRCPHYLGEKRGGRDVVFA